MEGGSERLASAEELMMFYNKPNAMGPTTNEICNREQTQEDRDFIRKYMSPIDVRAMEAWQLRYGPELSCRLPSNMGTRTSVDLKGRSVPNKDLGESSETMMEDSNPAADSSATATSSGTDVEAKGGCIQNHA